MNRLCVIAVASAICMGFAVGHKVGAAGVQAKFDQAQQAWAEERQTAIEQALAESETQRAVERAFTAQLSTAIKEYDDEKNLLAAAARADRDRAARQLRDARSSITAALNRAEWATAAPCFRAADTTLAALGGCTGAYRDMADRYGECLAGMQMIEKTWNAARDVCR